MSLEPIIGAYLRVCLKRVDNYILIHLEHTKTVSILKSIDIII